MRCKPLLFLPAALITALLLTPLVPLFSSGSEPEPQPAMIAQPPAPPEALESSIEAEEEPEPTPTPHPPARAVTAALPADREAVKAEILRVFGTHVAVAVAMQESGLRSHIYNGLCCYGVFQIHLTAHWPNIPGSSAEEKVAWLYDYRNNIAFAKRLYDRQGWQPWEAYTSGAYLKYMH